MLGDDLALHEVRDLFLYGALCRRLKHSSASLPCLIARCQIPTICIIFASMTVGMFLFNLQWANNITNELAEKIHHDHYGWMPDATTKLSSFTVDILSVASVKQLDLLRAQQQMYRSHVSVRNFFNATEEDDADPNCHEDITWDHVKNVSNFCRSNERKSAGTSLSDFQRRYYARKRWLAEKKNPTGWLCAQVRPFSGLMKVYRHYKTTEQPLPDYFLLIDDDTYYNMDMFQKNFEMRKYGKVVYAGCLMQLPVFTAPWGGFGLILSKEVLESLFRGIQCPPRGQEDVAICDKLKENAAGELQYFTNGMNLVELMYKYATTEKYRNVKQWTTGFCMHSVSFFVASMWRKEFWFISDASCDQ